MTAIMEATARIAAPAQEAADIPRKLWTRAEYRQLGADGYLQDGRYELVLGEIVKKMGQGRWHIIIGMRIIKILEDVFGFDRLQSQGTLPLGENGEPEPDLAVLNQSIEQFADQEPSEKDTVLVVEVSNTTLRYDLSRKVRQYGSVGIPEYWVIDIPNRLLHVFREPTATGYALETVLMAGDQVFPLAAPDAVVRVADLLPPPSRGSAPV